MQKAGPNPQPSDDEDEEDEDGSLIPEAIGPWNGFITLSSQRQFTSRGLPQPITLSDMKSYFLIMCLTAGEARAYMGWIVAMDRVYLDNRYKVAEDEAKKNARKRNRGVR